MVKLHKGGGFKICDQPGSHNERSAGLRYVINQDGLMRGDSREVINRDRIMRGLAEDMQEPGSSREGPSLRYVTNLDRRMNGQV